MHSTHNPSSITRTPVAEKPTFSSKERDTETGLSYFGARYYSSDLSIWLSVDPMSDKYPSLSPYVYCANNPVELVDPNGEDYEVVVDEKAMTITIKASYYTFAENKERVLEGVQAWNNNTVNTTPSIAEMHCEAKYNMNGNLRRKNM